MFVFVVHTWLVLSAGAATEVGPVRTTAQSKLLSASAEIKDVLRAASEATVDTLDSSPERAVEYLTAMDGSVEPVRARAHDVLRAYFEASPLLGPPRLLGGTETGTCEPELAAADFVTKYDLPRYQRNWLAAVTSLFPAGKSAADYHAFDSKPFTTSKLKNAFELAFAVGLEVEMVTALQFMLIFGKSNDLVAALSRIEQNRMLHQTGLHLLALWALDPQRKFSVFDDTLRIAFKAFSLVTEPSRRTEIETLVGDLADHLLSPASQREVDAWFKGDAKRREAAFVQLTAQMLYGFGTTGRLAYIYHSETHRGYSDLNVVGRLQTPGAVASGQRLIAFAATLGIDVEHTEVINALAAIGDVTTLIRLADEAKSRNADAWALTYYAAAGDLDGVKRAVAAMENLDQRVLSDHLDAAIDLLADDTLIEAFIAFLRADIGEHAAEFAHRHSTRSRVALLPVPRTLDLEHLHDWYLTAPVSPRQRGTTAAEVLTDARRSLNQKSLNSAMNDAVRAAFLHAEGR